MPIPMPIPYLVKGCRRLADPFDALAIVPYRYAFLCAYDLFLVSTGVLHRLPPINKPLKHLFSSTTNINSTEALRKVDEFLGADPDRAWRASDGGPFRALLTVPCAHKFVWTELTWHYFTATSSTPSYERSRDIEPEKHIFVGEGTRSQQSASN